MAAQKKWKNVFSGIFDFFGYKKVPKVIVNQIPRSGCNRKSPKSRAHFFFDIQNQMCFSGISMDFVTVFGRTHWAELSNGSGIFENFRKSPNSKSRYLQNYFDFFKKFWCFGKPRDSTFELCELERLARPFSNFWVGSTWRFFENSLSQPHKGGSGKNTGLCGAL